MDNSDFAFKNGGKRPMVKTLPSGESGRGSLSIGSNSGRVSVVSPSRAPVPKFTVGGGKTGNGASGSPGARRGSDGNSGAAFFIKSNANNMAKVSPKNFTKRSVSKYGAKNSQPKINPTSPVNNGSAPLFVVPTINEYSDGIPEVKKVSTDNQVTSAQPSPRKSLRLQPDSNNTDKRIPTNDELRLFSVPPGNSSERNKMIQNKSQSRGRDIRSEAAAMAFSNKNEFEYELPNSTKPGDKRTSTTLYRSSIGSVQSNDIKMVDEMEVYGNSLETHSGVRDKAHRNSDNIIVDLTNPDEERPRDSVLNVFSRIRAQVGNNSDRNGSLENHLGFPGKRQSTTGSHSDPNARCAHFNTIVESIVTINPEVQKERANSLLQTGAVNNHRYSESQVVNAFEGSKNENSSSILDDTMIINQGGIGVGRTSVQMVNLNETSNKTAKKGAVYEGGNTFKLDEYGLEGHLKWLYGEETEINIALGPNAREINIDAVKTNKSYHVNELDPLSQLATASKIRKWVNPIHGRIFVVLTTSFALVGIFFQSLIYNRLNKWTTNANGTSSSSDCGGVYVEPFSINSMLGPCSKTLSALGGLVVNELRKGEIIRMFWAMWMHTGFIHIGFNVISQAQLGYMIEPDWGMLRFFLLFFLSGVGGNLAVAVISPCSLTVGSSGGLFGITAASIPYTFENWNNLPAPMFMFIFGLFSLVIGMILSFTGVTNPWAHIGGFVVGILYTFTTMEACKGCSPEDRLDRYNRMAALPLFRLFMKQDKDWINKQLEEKKRKKMDRRNSKIAQQWRKNQRVRKNALIKEMKIEKTDNECNDGIGLTVDDHGIKRRTDLMILIDRVPVEKVKIITKLKIFLRERIKSFREKKVLWTFRILSAILLIFYFIIGWLGSLYPPLYWPNPIGVISFSDGATQCGCCYVNDVYTCGSNPAFIEWCNKQGKAAQPNRSIFGYEF